MDLGALLKKILLANELSDNPAAAYRFSDADGREGRSGYSFGVCQFDLGHNPRAEEILHQCGFGRDIIAALKRQEIPANLYDSLLAAQRDVIDVADRREIAAIISHVRNVLQLRSIRLADDLAFLALCDYHNQFYFSAGGPKAKMAAHLATVGAPVTAGEIFDFALDETAYGQTRKGADDLRRRHGNIRRIWEEATA